MPVRFETASRRFPVEVETYRSLNLLAHAQIEELEIGSQCGGHGICGGDRVRVECEPGAVSPITEEERRHLTADELAEGWRLGCQCFPSSEDAWIRVHVPKF